MKNLMRKAAEAKSALVSREAANNTTEIVVIILGVVVIATAVMVGLKTILGDDSTGILGAVDTKLKDWAKTNGFDLTPVVPGP